MAEKWNKRKYDKKYILEGGVYSKTEIIEMWKSFKFKIIKREQDWNIKISDYIFKNYKKERMFSDINHITSRMAKEIALRILKYMGYNGEILLELPMMDDMETIIYKDVKEALDLEFEDHIIRKYSFGRASLNNYEMNMEEYINQLCQFTRFCIMRETEETK